MVRFVYFVVVSLFWVVVMAAAASASPSAAVHRHHHPVCPEGCICSIGPTPGECLRCRHGYRSATNGPQQLASTAGKSCRPCPADCADCDDQGACLLPTLSAVPHRQQQAAAFSGRTDVFLQDGPLPPASLSVREGESVVINQRHFSRHDPSIQADKTLHYILVDPPPELGVLELSGRVLQLGDSITMADLTGEKLKYRSQKEIGWLAVRDRIRWNVTVSRSGGGAGGEKTGVLLNGRVMDSNGKVLHKTEGSIKSEPVGGGDKTPYVKVAVSVETLQVVVEPKDDKAPQASVHGELSVDEGGVEILSPDMVTVHDSDTRPEQLVVEIVQAPKYGYLEVRDRSVVRKVDKEFPLSALLEEQLSYIQSEHESIEPRHDSFRFQVRDAVANRSPIVQLDIVIENINDEPPQIGVTRPLMVKHPKSVVLSSDQLGIKDPDTEPIDVQITLSTRPSGRLQLYDQLTGMDRTLEKGDSFSLQDVMEGDVTYLSSPEDRDVIAFQVSDGDFQSEAKLLVQQSDGKSEQYADGSVTVSETAAPSCIVEFNATEWAATEDGGTVQQIPVTRSGDLSVTCSVLCWTEAAEQQQATPSEDYETRPIAESARIFFLRGVTTVPCLVRIIDDGIFEGEEQFKVRLSEPQVELTSDGIKSAVTGKGNQLTVYIRDDEDVTRVQFNQSDYRVRPASSEDSIAIQVDRKGDLRFASRIYINGMDGSAKEGRDYSLKTRRLDFAPGEASNNIRVSFLAKGTWSKNFRVQLSPSESVNAQLGQLTTASIFIPPSALAPGPALLPAEPIVVSLIDYDRVDLNNTKPIAAGYPLVCVSPCDPKYPLYNTSTQRLCRDLNIDATKIRFSWEISNDGNVFQRLSEPTAFSSVEDRVLDSVFFARNFVVRCLAQPHHSGSTSGPASKSRSVTITNQLCGHPTVTEGLTSGQQPFSASLTYVNASDPLHPDTMHIRVMIPHSDGLVPVLSTQPLQGIRHVMNDPAYRSVHRCSNLHPGLGFLLSSVSEKPEEEMPYELSMALRRESAVRLYSHLDSAGCLWHFEAWYTMTELVQLCGGQVTSSQQREKGAGGQVQLTVRVPLYVTLVGASSTGAGTWKSVEHQTEMEFSFSYASVLLGRRGLAESKLALAVEPHVTRVRSDPNNGRLVVEFQTETRSATGIGRGYQQSSARLISPAHLPRQLGFALELTEVKQLTSISASYLQKWRAISNYTLQDFTGNYTLKLIPCSSSSSAGTLKTDEDCPADPDALPINLTLPIHYQQPFRPEPVHFSLETTFQLTNDVGAFLRKPRSINEIKEAEFEGSFQFGERVYGRVLWHPSNELSPGYRLVIERLYLCAGRDDYVPSFQPDSSHYGCLENSQRLKYRLLLLDREDPYGSDKTVQGLSLDAKFANQVEPLKTVMAGVPSMDGFVFSVDPLFQLEPGIRWFLQVSYSVQPVVAIGSNSRWRRSSSSAQQQQQRRRGTNVRLLPLDWPGSSTSSSVGAGQQTVTVLATALLSAGLLVVLVMAVVIFLFLHYRPSSNRKKRNNRPPITNSTIEERTPIKTRSIKTTPV